jgi:hypothetical protein
MVEEALQTVDGLLASGDVRGTLDWLVRQYTEQRDFISLFEARRIRCRYDFGLPLIENEVRADLPAEKVTAYEKALIEAARETGELALQAGNIPAAWRFFRAIGEPAPVAAALESAEPGEDADEIISIALQEGVHPAKGLELVLGQYGMCRAITVFGMYTSQKGRTECIALLVRKLHADVTSALSRAIESQEGTKPGPQSIITLIEGRDWLFGEYDYYVDTSHLLSLLPYSLEVSDPEILRLLHELCEYGRCLSSMFQFKGQPPFEQPFLDYGEYIQALLGEQEDDRISHFRRKLEAAAPDEYSGGTAQLLVRLLARQGRYDEALEVSLAHLADEDPATLMCPTALQLCSLSGSYDRFKEFAKQRGDVLGYVAASVLPGQ